MCPSHCSQMINSKPISITRQKPVPICRIFFYEEKQTSGLSRFLLTGQGHIHKKTSKVRILEKLDNHKKSDS